MRPISSLSRPARRCPVQPRDARLSPRSRCCPDSLQGVPLAAERCQARRLVPPSRCYPRLATSTHPQGLFSAGVRSRCQLPKHLGLGRYPPGLSGRSSPFRLRGHPLAAWPCVAPLVSQAHSARHPLMTFLRPVLRLSRAVSPVGLVFSVFPLPGFEPCALTLARPAVAFSGRCLRVSSSSSRRMMPTPLEAT